MAIIIEEERSRGGLLTMGMYLVFLVVVGAALYYLFFKQPTLIEVAVPESFESAQELSKISLDPNEVLQSPEFQALRPYISAPSTGNVGRPNPFLGF